VSKLIWPRTLVTDRLGITYPLIQAPMAGAAANPELVTAVANAGGLGSLGAGYLSPDALRASIRAIRAQTKRPFAVNLFAPESPTSDPAAIARMAARLRPYRAAVGLPPDVPAPQSYAEDFADQIAVVLDEGVPIFSFVFGIPPRDMLERFKERGVTLIGTATTVREAQQLADADVDLIVAQGSEAGGHRATFLGPAESALIGTIALVPQIVDRVSVPVIAAGGIMDGRGVVAALALGAAGVQMGTAFLTRAESGAPAAQKEAILRGGDDSTTLIRGISGKWARGIPNQLSQALATPADDILPYPIQHALTREIRRAASQQGRQEYLALWSGQAGHLAGTAGAAQLIAEVDQQVRALLASAAMD
jgi:nitronate monooxygenase